MDDQDDIMEENDFAQIEAEELYTRKIGRMEDERELKRIKMSHRSNYE